MASTAFSVAGLAIATPEPTAAAPADTARLTVVMQARATRGIPFDVSISDSEGAIVASAALSNEQSFAVPDLAPGTYTVAESIGDLDMRAAGIECSNGQTSTSDSIDVTLDAGADVTCTVTNDPQTAKDIELSIIVDWNGAPPDPAQIFEVCLRGPSYPAGDEANACAIADLDESWSGGAFWDRLDAGEYVVTVIDPGDEWDVDVIGNPVTIPRPSQVAGEPAHATVRITHVSPATAPPSTTPSSAQGPTTGSSGGLPPTGASGSRTMALIASALIAAGLALGALRRRPA